MEFHQPEWLGNVEEPQQQPPAFLRLVVKDSPIVPKGSVTVIDSCSTDSVSIGRDRLRTGPRLRLKELVVSKHHASIFWGGDFWAVVDNGSMYGTFICPSDSGSSSRTLVSDEHRLSETKKASLPRRISHLDLLRIGNTIFVIHAHELPSIPCSSCSLESCPSELTLWDNSVPSSDFPNGRNEIISPLHHSASQRKRSKEGPQAALSHLKIALLAKNSYSKNGREEGLKADTALTYADRSAQRRSLHPGRLPSPPRPPQSLLQPSRNPASQKRHHLYDIPTYRPRAFPGQGDITHRDKDRGEDVSSSKISNLPGAYLTAATPISFENPGHRLLLKQGWTPGTALGSQKEGFLPGESVHEEPHTLVQRLRLVEPLKQVYQSGRSGLGFGAGRE
ncbi:uncharacterized protein EI90DRAFT_3037020 [Cantharellus anzutake]|uniref:uncharacterized protein n=1 Tax=Cantharellus anzutake TaxID=1750568 RepID=UPI0019058FF2|nr:uncharacterized protein EI90DRAFT_3037020 [Cantharellus anzutake]KAF8339544.1 hypothetical protein EI90DRAFT_3037020 [Cantharellus anzutake]